MYAILDIDVSDDNYCEGDADHLCVPLSEAMLRAILTRVTVAQLAKQQDGGFHSITYWDYSVTVFGNDDRQYTPGQLVASPTMANVAEPDYSTIVVMPGGVRWEGGIRHTAIHWTSEEVSVEQLRKWQAQLTR
jgi:hypothetical protein